MTTIDKNKKFVAKSHPIQAELTLPNGIECFVVRRNFPKRKPHFCGYGMVTDPGLGQWLSNNKEKVEDTIFVYGGVTYVSQAKGRACFVVGFDDIHGEKREFNTLKDALLETVYMALQLAHLPQLGADNGRETMLNMLPVLREEAEAILKQNE